jgi:aminoglycoside 3-N-acetyltransferase I
LYHIDDCGEAHVTIDHHPAWHVRRLRQGDRDLARRLFTEMADVFGEPSESLSDSYVDALLARDGFWVIAALEAGGGGTHIIGGLTAHTLPMTREESAEIFIYDLAVRADRQRRGVGRLLINTLRADATAAGIGVVFVPVDDADEHALDFYRAVGGVPAPVTIFTFDG